MWRSSILKGLRMDTYEKSIAESLSREERGRWLNWMTYFAGLDDEKAFRLAVERIVELGKQHALVVRRLRCRASGLGIDHARERRLPVDAHARLDRHRYDRQVRAVDRADRHIWVFVGR